MTGGIDNDFYCRRWKKPKEQCGDYFEYGRAMCAGEKTSCLFCGRKWPTPEQFKEEHGGEYPKYGAVYMRDFDGVNHFWEVRPYGDALKSIYENQGATVVCACTPWGKPPDGWRPR